VVYLPRRRGLAAVSAISIAVIALAGCGGGSPSTRSTPTSSSPTSSATASPTPTALTTEKNSSVGGDELSAHVAAAVVKAGSGRFETVEMSGEGAGAFTLRSGLRMSYTINDHGAIKIVAVPAGVYVNDGETHFGKHWGYYGTRAKSKANRNAEGMLLRDVASLDPLIQAMAWHAVGNFTVTGNPNVAGTPTTEYYGSIRPSDYIAVYPALARGQLKNLVKDVQVWVSLDANDLPIRIRTATHYANSEDDTLDTKYDAWGKAVKVVEPKGSDVADAT
jgi:hypothetical protein